MATKEYAANTGLDALEKDIKATEFNLHSYKMTGTSVILKLGDLLSNFEDFATRL